MVDLAHDVRGSGPLLVLVHGITEDRRSWDPLTNELAHDHRVLRVDLRGHGESPTGDAYGAADYAADLVPLVGEAPLLIGHSLGGLVVSAYAAAHETRGVINVDQPLRFEPFQQAARTAQPALQSAAFESTVYAMFDTMRGALPDDEWARLTRLRAPKPEVVLGTWAMLFDLDWPQIDAAVRQVAEAVRAPYLTILGETPDPAYPPWLAEVLPQAQLEVWEGTGHYPHLADPDRFIARVREFERTVDES